MAPRVLSVQSSVVYGVVGNRAAVLPLQVSGFDVAELDTVQFATHTGYPKISGRKCTAEELRTVFDGLYAVGCHEGVDGEGWSGLLTGYVPGVDGVNAVSYMAEKVRQQSESCVWVLDPVMGDEERGLYVAPEIPPIYKELAPKADIVTPNMFELELLSGVKCHDWQSLNHALDVLHACGCKRIVVTTFRVVSDTSKQIHVVGSGPGERFKVDVPYYDRPYQGTGDLFAALLLANVLKDGLDSFRGAVCKALDAMRPILQDTGAVYDAVTAKHGITDYRQAKAEGGHKAALVCRACELRIVDNLDAVRQPKSHHTPVDL